MGVVATTGNLYQLAKEGKIHIIGSTSDNDFEHDGIQVLSVSKKLGVPQTSGGILLSLKPNADKQFVNSFMVILNQALETERVKEAMLKTNITPAGIIGINNTTQKIMQMRKDVTNILK